jgi:hypothetical protein
MLVSGRNFDVGFLVLLLGDFSPLRVCNETDILIYGISFLLFRLGLVDWMMGCFCWEESWEHFFGRDRQIDDIDLWNATNRIILLRPLDVDSQRMSV